MVDLCNFKTMIQAIKNILNNRVVQHLLFWCFYVLIYFFNYRINEPALTGILVTMLYLPGHLFFTYSQIYFLIPRFLLRRKKLLYILLSALFLKVAINIHWVFLSFVVIPLRTGAPREIINWNSLWQFNTHHFLPFFALITICGLAVSIKLLKKWYLENERKEQAEKEKTRIELEMLKAQVHPHFLFNTLNNLYALVLTKAPSAPLVVTHLSDLLRYMLYECNEKEVPLEKEVEVLKKYIELEKLRYGNRVDVSFTASGNIEQLSIAPLLLLPFVENSFKYGTSDWLDQCWINLHLNADNNNLSFNLSNSYSLHNKKNSPGGLGLQNIKKRLELIYTGRYELAISETDEIYNVKLNLQLNFSAQNQVSVNNMFVQIKPVPAI
jgi:two-component system, LytTR family, sensor kinase